MLQQPSVSTAHSRGQSKVPLTDAEERAEHELRMDVMSIQLEQSRVNIDKMRSEMKWETRKFILQLIVALGAAVAAGVALGRFWLFHS